MNSHRRARATALAALVLVSGCRSSNPMAPAPPAQRAVNVRVTDAGGASVAHSLVYAIDDLGATTQLTDTSGTARFTLTPGPWTVYTSTPVPGQVAASTGTVAPGGADTVLFRLRLAPESMAIGQVLLSGLTDHSFITVGVFQLPIATSTLSDGSYRLDGLPPGDWQRFARHAGFQTASFALHVPSADTLLIDPDPITLQPTPIP